MIIWINGPFGAGKTTAAMGLVSRDPGLRLFDPEDVGSMVSRNLADQQFTDFQQLPSWRSLTPVVADEIARRTGQALVAVQTVLREDYWDELIEGFDRLDQTVIHIVLDVDPGVLVRRIRDDKVEAGALGWRLQHVTAYGHARDWIAQRADLVIDTTELTAEEVANSVLTFLSGREGYKPWR